MCKYRIILNAFMSHRDNVPYTSTYHFEDDVLIGITLEKIVRYFNKKIFGVADPAENTKPTLGLSASVYFWKKAISYFMPMKTEPWNKRTKDGNPMRSELVNKMIKRVKKFEVQKQGKLLKA